MALVLSRKCGERILLEHLKTGDRIELIALDGKARIGIEASPEWRIRRVEPMERTKAA